ncbi:type II secretion system protein GspM [Nitrincola nitratireducens]|uniref:General secretion pathway protein M n=1 Tax=Nitrincola nitratireducens TaxID=1229521 RepID=W9V6S8_9GAMM|nr:type II secretion system protein GspM [Nitrincola nitratireducens]EXJ11797.1 General secretion pathway protein M [Nitrincola nitratireducens]
MNWNVSNIQRLGLLSTIGVLLVLVYAVYVSGVYAAYKAYGDQVHTVSERVARLQGFVEAGPLIEAQTHEAERFMHSLVYPRTVDDLNVAAQLQQKVRAVFQAVEGDILGVQIMPTQALGGFEQVRVHIRAELDIEGLETLLKRLEEESPKIWIESLAVQPMGANRSGNRLTVQIRFVSLRWLA